MNMDPRPAAELERDTALLLVLQKLWTYSLTTKSDDVRSYADEIAEAASRGFITTIVIPNGSLHGRLWKLTPKGTQFLWDEADRLLNEEDHYAARYTTPTTDEPEGTEA
jgi:hypothetical protein